MKAEPEDDEARRMRRIRAKLKWFFIIVLLFIAFDLAAAAGVLIYIARHIRL